MSDATMFLPLFFFFHDPGCSAIQMPGHCNNNDAAVVSSLRQVVCRLQHALENFCLPYHKVVEPDGLSQSRYCVICVHIYHVLECLRLPPVASTNSRGETRGETSMLDILAVVTWCPWGEKSPTNFCSLRIRSVSIQTATNPIQSASLTSHQSFHWSVMNPKES